MLDVLNMVRVVDTVQVADTVHMVLAADTNKSVAILFCEDDTFLE
jgi:hypothetical protein